MAATTRGTSRTARLLALMKQGDDSVNSRDLAAMDAVHDPACSRRGPVVTSRSAGCAARHKQPI
jgi:hypothetical protein